jgi:hypothetical protein
MWTLVGNCGLVSICKTDSGCYVENWLVDGKSEIQGKEGQSLSGDNRRW